jgi:hypothetical protein
MSPERTEKARQLQALAAQIAAALPGDWRHGRPEDDWAAEAWAELRGPDGQALTLAADWRRRRLTVRDQYPVSAVDGTRFDPWNWNRTEAPSIGVALERPAGAIAADIRRRLLPAYREALAAAVERCRQHDDAVRAKRGLSARLHELLGERPPSSAASDRIWGNVGECHVSGQVWSDGTVKLELSHVTEAQAVALLKLLGS